MMKKLAIPLSLAAVAMLAACGNQQVRSADADSTVYVTPVSGATLRTGPGKVSVLMDPTGPVDGISWQRMTLAMEDGSSQIVDRRGAQVAWGEHVRVRSDSTLARDPNTTRATP
jgi:outer membrane lipopolysaccharide assembly protein LptE/RlpB